MSLLGAPSNILAITLPGVLPAQVVGLSATAATSTTISLSWYADTVATGSRAYVVSYKLSASTTWTKLTAPVISTGSALGNVGTVTTTVTGLETGQSYDFEVYCFNNVGSGPVSAIVTRSTTGSTGTVTTWNPSDLNNVTLDTVTHLTATAVLVTGNAASVRSTTSHSTGKFVFSGVFSSIGADAAIGLASAQFPLPNLLGSSDGGVSVGVYTVSPPQAVFINDVQLTALNSAASIAGDECVIAVDLNAMLLWFTSGAMISAIGAGAWNNQLTANPATGVGGISISALTGGPFYICFNDDLGQGVCILRTGNNVGSHIGVGIPAGFQTWDNGVSGVTLPPSIPTNVTVGTITAYSASFSWTPSATGTVVDYSVQYQLQSGGTVIAAPLNLRAGSQMWGAAGHFDQGGPYTTIPIAQQIRDLQNIFGTVPGTVVYRAFGDGVQTGFASAVSQFQAAGIIPIVMVITYPTWTAFANEAAAYNFAYASVAASIASAPNNLVWEIGNEWILQSPLVLPSNGGLLASDYNSQASYPLYRGAMAGAVAAIRDKGGPNSQALCSVMSGWTFQGFTLALAADLVSYTPQGGRNLMWDFTVVHWYNDTNGPSSPDQMTDPANFNGGLNTFTLQKPAGRPLFFTEFGSSTGNITSYESDAGTRITGIMTSMHNHAAVTNTEAGCCGGCVYMLYQMPGVQTDYYLYRYTSGSTGTIAPQGTAVKAWIASNAPTAPSATNTAPWINGATVTGSSATISGLLDSTSYNVQVTPASAAGNGPTSAPVIVTTSAPAHSFLRFRGINMIPSDLSVTGFAGVSSDMPNVNSVVIPVVCSTASQTSSDVQFDVPLSTTATWIANALARGYAVFLAVNVTCRDGSTIQTITPGPSFAAVQNFFTALQTVCVQVAQLGLSAGATGMWCGVELQPWAGKAAGDTGPFSPVHQAQWQSIYATCKAAWPGGVISYAANQAALGITTPQSDWSAKWDFWDAVVFNIFPNALLSTTTQPTIEAVFDTTVDPNPLTNGATGNHPLFVALDLYARQLGRKIIINASGIVPATGNQVSPETVVSRPPPSDYTLGSAWWQALIDEVVKHVGIIDGFFAFSGSINAAVGTNYGIDYYGVRGYGAASIIDLAYSGLTGTGSGGSIGTPTALQASATTSSITLSWGAVMGNSITYIAEISPDGVSNWTALSPTSGLSVTVTGLSQSTTYYLRVHAVAGATAGPVSIVVPCTTQAIVGGVTRTYTNQPGSDQSFWNTPIKDGAILSGPTEPMTISARKANTINGSNFGAPIWVGSASDPLVTVVSSGGTGTQRDPNLTASVHIPVGASSAGPYPGDNQLNVFDTTQPYKMWCFGGALADGSTIQAGTTTLQCGNAEVDDASGLMEDQSTGNFGYNQGVGVIRAWELDPSTNPSMLLQHTLRFACDWSQLNAPPAWNDTTSINPVTGMPYIAWPQTHGDYNAPTTYTGNMPIGATLCIPASDPEPTGWPVGALMLYRNAKYYGWAWRDTATGGVTLYTEPSVDSHPRIAEMRQYFNQIVSRLCVLKNQLGPTSRKGVGNPLVAGPPPLNTGSQTGTKSININTPVNVLTGSSFTITAALVGYAGPPTLTYTDDNGTAQQLPAGATITASSLAFTHSAMSAGSHTLKIADTAGTVGTTTYSVGTVSTGPSADGSFITAPSTQTLTDNSGNVWGITGGQVTVNGTVDATTANVIELAWKSGLMWQENNASLWWSKTSPTATWSPTNGTTTGPFSTTPTPTPTPVPTGSFSVSGGKVIGPDGNPWIGKGLNIYWEQADSVVSNAAATPLLTLFPGTKIIRVAYANNPGSSYPPVSQITNLAARCSALGIVIIIEDHTGISNPPYTGSQLTAELAWYTSLASTFKGNPYVWFGTYNEPGNQNGGAAITTQQVAIYNAIRATGNNTIVAMELPGGGNPGTIGAGFGMTASSYATMRNIVWDLHYYGWVSGNSTDQATVNAALQGSVAAGQGVVAAQTITSADGIVPVIIGESGDSTNGGDVDPNATQVVKAVGDSGLICTYWHWASGAGADNLTNGANKITSPYGTQVAAIIAATPVPPPPPSGNGNLIQAPLSSAAPGIWEIGTINGMKYKFLRPSNYNPTFTYPFVLYLHQLDQGTPAYSGNDIVQDQIDPWFNSTAFRTSYPCFILAPLLDQTADSSGNTINWGGVSTTTQASETNIIALIAQFRSQYSIATNKIFVTGNSMGGIGSWDYIIKYNNKTGTKGKIFQGAMPLAGAVYDWGNPTPQPSVVSGLTNVGIWAIHGAQDDQVPLFWDQAMYAAYGGGAGNGSKAPSGQMRYTQDPNLGHDVWDTYYPLPMGKQYYDWLFAL